MRRQLQQVEENWYWRDIVTKRRQPQKGYKMRRGRLKWGVVKQPWQGYR